MTGSRARSAAQTSDAEYIKRLWPQRGNSSGKLLEGNGQVWHDRTLLAAYCSNVELLQWGTHRDPIRRGILRTCSKPSTSNFPSRWFSQACLYLLTASFNKICEEVCCPKRLRCRLSQIWLAPSLTTCQSSSRTWCFPVGALKTICVHTFGLRLQTVNKSFATLVGDRLSS